MLKSKPFLVGYKLFFALLGFSALITEVVVLAERGTFNPVNFFSFFTIESNIVAVAALLIGAMYAAAGQSHKIDLFRGAATTYILIVGLGFSFLLAGLEDTAFTAVPWDNVVLHYLMPLALIVDFIIDRPKQPITFKAAIWWLLFPVAYLIYSLTRGYFTGWYPYPFLNVEANGYQYVITGILGIVVIGLLVTGVVTLVSGTKRFKKNAR
jgi:hypothetical protein